jgi:RNA-directed DNA polymerase
MSIYTPQENLSLLLYQSCDDLKRNFFELENKRDVAQLLEISYQRLTYHISVVPEKRRYTVFSISKKSGRLREISAPCTSLKIIQRKLSQVLYSVYEPKAPVHGFIPSKSIVTNARQHTNKRFVLNIDLKDFFPSIHFGRVKGIFMKPPYNLTPEVAIILAKICCYDGKLPQGAPTSPIVSNMICARMDSELRKLAKECQCTYTRYADDITFSTTLINFPEALACNEIPDLVPSSLIVPNPDSETKTHYVGDSSTDKSKLILGERLKSIIQNNGFEINYNKVRLQGKKQHQEVTGLTVNKAPNVKRSLIREISSMLHIWHRYGLKNAEERHSVKWRSKTEQYEDHTPEYMKRYKKDIHSSLFRQVLRGKINFVGMVKGKDNSTYLTYLQWFRELSKRERESSQ